MIKQNKKDDLTMDFDLSCLLSRHLEALGERIRLKKSGKQEKKELKATKS
jgi:hypothetical protein